MSSFRAFCCDLLLEKFPASIGSQTFLTRQTPLPTYLVMELVPAVQVESVKLLHVFGTDHALILTIHQWLSGSLLRGRGYGDRPPNGHLHLQVHCLLLLLLLEGKDSHLGQLGVR